MTVRQQARPLFPVIHEMIFRIIPIVKIIKEDSDFKQILTGLNM